MSAAVRPASGPAALVEQLVEHFAHTFVGNHHGLAGLTAEEVGPMFLADAFNSGGFAHQQLGQFLTTFGGHNRPVAFTNVLA